MTDAGSPPPSRPHPHTLAPDLLRGAEEIAAFLYGSGRERRKVYHLVETASLPHFRLGQLVCARRTTLMAWIEAQERKGGRAPVGESPLKGSNDGSAASARTCLACFDRIMRE